MKISPFLFLAIFCSLISLSSAAEISVTDLHCVAHGVAPTGYTGDAEQIILAGSGNDIIATDIFGSGMTVNAISNFPADVGSIYNTKNWLYVILLDGRVYKIPSSPYQRDFENLNFADADHKDGYYLGDFSTGTTYQNQIQVDDSGDIFIYSAYNQKIYKVDGTTFISSEFVSSSFFSTYAISANRNRCSFWLYDNYLYVAVIDVGTNLDVYRFSSANNEELIYSDVISGPNNVFSYISPLSNGNWILGAATSTGKRTTIIEYNGTASLGNIYSDTGYYPESTATGNIIVKPNGIICFAATTQDKIVTFGTISGAGGVYSEGEGTTPPEITYNAKTINAEYKTYYNQTNVRFLWSLGIDDEFINTYNTVYSEPIYNRYYWRIELFSPDDIFVNSYVIPVNWKYQKYTLGIFGSGDYVNAGNVQFNNIVGNGTYTVKIYELNRITGAKAFLDSDTFEILSQTNPSGSGGISETSGETAAYNFLNSPYLVAIVIIGVVGFQFGRGRDGNINGSAMIVLIPLAVGLCCLMGILPMWILYVMVLCIIAFVAVKMSSGGS